jgi:hypothetical protein
MRMYRLSFLSLILAAALFAQADRGSVVGTITDPSGGYVAGVSLQLRNQATNLDYSTVSKESGSFAFLNLPVGAYTLTAQGKGFQSQEIKGIDVQVNQQARIDIALRVGEVTQTVEVSASAAMIQSESTDVGEVIDNKRFLDLPLTLGGGIRNPSSFIFLSPGVAVNGTWEKHIGGGGSFTDQVYYDGIALSRGDLSNDAEVTPSVDAIAEFKLITNNYSAEYAHALSGVTSYTTRSGTNRLHGSAWEFDDNDKFDARGFFPSKRAHRAQNEFGFTLGGPAIIPKLYNGRNRTFWFASFDQFFIRGGQLTGLNTLPTGPMLKGDFSQLPGQIFDPATTVIAANGTATRTPFPNNAIPASRFSAISAKMLPFAPIPELPGLTNNSISPLSSPRANQRHHGFKIDHAFNDKHHISMLYNSSDRPSVKSGSTRLLPIGNDPIPLSDYNVQDVTTIISRINYDWTVSPTFLNHVGIGYSVFHNPNFSTSYNQGWEQPNGGKLGLLGTQFDLFPVVTFTQGYTQYGNATASNNYFNTETYLDNATWIKGAHTLKFGAEFQAHQDNYRNYGNGGGTFNYSQLETGLPSAPNSGNPFASFLLGTVDSGSSYFRGSLPGGRYKYFGMYVDDTYKVTHKLTLNIGLRWEFTTPTSDPLGRISYLDPTVPNPGAGNIPGAVVFGGSGPGHIGSNQYFDTHYKDFAPRIGLAYQATKNTVVRGGYGIFYGEWNEQSNGIPQTGFAFTPSFTSPNAGLTSPFNWDGGFPQNFNHPPIITPTVANGQVIQLADRKTGGRLSYSQQWNLTIERQLTQSFMVSGAYVANKGTHLLDQSNTQVNQVNPAYFSLGQSLLTSNINSPAAQAAGFHEPFPGFAQLFGGQATVAQALRPFPQYQGITVVHAPVANSTYNSFQFKADKRFTKGFSSTVAYTWSKFLSDGVAITTASGAVVRENYYKRETSLYTIDQPQILAVSFNYDIAYGRTSQVGMMRKVFGGWTVSTFVDYAAGFPIPISTVNTMSFIFNGGLRPNLTGDALRATQGSGGFDPNRDKFLNPTAFANPAVLQFGNAPVYLPIRQPSTKNESLGVFRNIKMREWLSAQFRTEISNPLNRVVFGTPVTDFSAKNFGSIVSQGNSARQIQFGLKLIW